MKRIFLIRHGETPFNTDPVPKFRGLHPIPLSDEGKRHVDQTGQYLASTHKVKLDKILYSSVKRATQTAEAVKRYQPDAFFSEEPLLIDFDWGEWTGQPIPYGHGGPFKTQEDQSRFESDPNSFIIPGGETFYTVLDRIHRLWRHIVDTEKPGSCIALVSHGAVLNLFMCYLTQSPLSCFWNYYMQAAGVTEINVKEDGRVVIAAHNIHHHLK